MYKYKKKKKKNLTHSSLLNLHILVRHPWKGNARQNNKDQYNANYLIEKFTTICPGQLLPLRGVPHNISNGVGNQ